MSYYFLGGELLQSLVNTVISQDSDPIFPKMAETKSEDLITYKGY